MEQSNKIIHFLVLLLQVTIYNTPPQNSFGYYPFVVWTVPLHKWTVIGLNCILKVGIPHELFTIFVIGDFFIILISIFANRLVIYMRCPETKGDTQKPSKALLNGRHKKDKVLNYMQSELNP